MIVYLSFFVLIVVNICINLTRMCCTYDYVIFM